MEELIFSFNKKELIIQCDINEKMKEILKRYCFEINKDIDSLYFTYYENEINDEFTLNQYINRNKGIKYKIYILVQEKFNIISNDININNIINDNSKIITLKYKIDKNKETVKIFGTDFVNKNKNLCKIIFEENEYALTANFDIKNNNKEFLEIKLKGINNITSISSIFYDCELLTSISDMSNLNISNFNNLSYIFCGCKSLKSLPDISKWDTSNILYMNHLFSRCSSLSYLPDISKWNTSNVTKMEYMFSSCLSLLSFPDISKWDTNNVLNMEFMFNECQLINFLPDISKWNTNNLKYMSYMFSSCELLSELPDISKWNTSKVINMSFMFFRCLSLVYIPDISKWNTGSLLTVNCMFYQCPSLSFIPERFNVNKKSQIISVFYGCINLTNKSEFNIDI